MNYLIDTHILLWYAKGHNKATKDIRQKIEKPTNTIFVSNASLWEITIKVAIGKLKLNGTIIDLRDYLFENNFEILEFDFNDLETLSTLPFYHQDPFDRMIIAQSKTKNLNIIWTDSQVQMYLM